MRIAEYKQTDTEVIESTMPILDEDGNETGEYEVIRKEIPVMSMVYRDMTEDEIAEMKKMQEEMPKTSYSEMVEELIRQKYSISDEIAIIRQRDIKPEEFEAYNEYAEECKRIARTNI